MNTRSYRLLYFQTILIVGLTIGMILGVIWWKRDMFQWVGMKFTNDRLQQQRTSDAGMRMTWSQNPEIPAAIDYAYTIDPSLQAKGLSFVPGPKDVVPLITKYRIDYSAVFDYGLDNVNKISAKDFLIMPALPSYGWDPNDILFGSGPYASSHSEFVYSVVGPDKKFVGIVVQVDDTGNFRIIKSIEDMLPEQISNALSILNHNQQIAAGSYEARLLYGGGPLGYVIIWLKSRLDSNDLFYPIEQWIQPGMNAGKIYSLDEFLSINRSQITAH